MQKSALVLAPPQDSGFTPEQTEYLAGFASGTNVARGLRGLPGFSGGTTSGSNDQVVAAFTGPDGLALQAAADTVAAGKKLCPEEEAKRRTHPFERYDDLVTHSREGRFPKGADVLMWKYHGLFYVAPAQNSYMCRLRFYGGLMTSDQLRHVARLSEEFGGGYADCTTRANLQIREIPAANAAPFLESLQEAGLVARGSGADNIRNVTGSPTAGIDPQELYDTRELTRQMHHYILNHREMYGLPRKFNIAFDGGGTISALEETNDIGFSAVRVGPDNAVPEGVYFRVAFGGITGHQDFARDSGLLLLPEECVGFAAAAVRVFIRHGDRTDRKKARLKYLLDSWGHDKFARETLAEWGRPALTLPLEQGEPRPPIARTAHIGWHAQKQPGLSYLGVVLPVGRLSQRQMQGLAALAERYGSGSLRLTVWQNLIIADIPDRRRAEVEVAVGDLGLGYEASGVRAGLVACTGSAGCKFANADTKKHALQIADHLDDVLPGSPDLNIHLTGCPHSCAQHYIGDIGLLGTKVERGEDMVDAYHLFVGGGYGADQNIGRELLRGIEADRVPAVLEKLLRAHLAGRSSIQETFLAWTQRLGAEQLREFVSGAEDLTSSLAR